MTSVLILLSGFDPGTYVIEDDGIPNNGIAQMRGPDGNVILFNIPTEFLTITASAGRDVVINLTESFGSADITVGSLTDPGQNPDSITVASIRGAGDVVLAANGAITELGSDAAADIVANSVVLSAGTGVGASGNALETQVTQLEAETTTGGINLSNLGNLVVGGLTDDVNGLDVETSGDILLTTSGSITLAEQSPGGSESVHGGSVSGNVTLIANGASSDIASSVDRDAIAAPGGNITLTAGRDILLGTGGLNFDNDVRARGSLTINAGRDLNVDGFADLASDGYGASTGGNLVVNAGRDINVLNATGTDGSMGAEGDAGGNVVLNAGPGGFVRLLATSSGTLFSSSGSVAVNADRLAINATAGITANNGGVTLRPKTEGWAIDLGSAVDGAFALEISDAEVNRIFSPGLTIGGDASGPLTATAAFGPANIQNLQLISGTDIRLTSAMTVANHLTLRAGDDVHFLAGTATTAGDLDVFVDQNGDDGNIGGFNSFGGAVTAGTPTITGGVDTDVLWGTTGNDTLNGVGGADVMNGRIGDDQYIVNHDGDVTVENASEGADTVFASVSYTLVSGTEVEVLRTTSQAGTGAINLTGNGFSQTVLGNNGVNTLSGGNAGDDIMAGFAGNDSYVVNSQSDQVLEAAGQGIDTVYASVSYVLANTEVEVLRTSSQSATTAINLTGNGFNQTLHGNNGVNTLNGGNGDDILHGYGGNDSYVVNSQSDQVFENAGQGTDTVFTSVHYGLAAAAEIEFLRTTSQGATSAINLLGSDTAQTIVGNAGANTIDGRGGNDTLHGLGGADSFAFRTALGAGNVDTVADYAVADDRILLDNAVFAGLAAGALAAGAFNTGAAASQADDRIVYNGATGALLFDADGSGAGAAIQFATLSTGLAMTAAEFVVI